MIMEDWIAIGQHRKSGYYSGEYYLWRYKHHIDGYVYQVAVLRPQTHAGYASPEAAAKLKNLHLLDFNLY